MLVLFKTKNSCPHFADQKIALIFFYQNTIVIIRIENYIIKNELNKISYLGLVSTQSPRKHAMKKVNNYLIYHMKLSQKGK